MSLIILRIAFGVFGLIALVTGSLSTFGGLDTFSSVSGHGMPLDRLSEAGASIENGFRFFAGIWLGVGLMLLYGTVRWETSRALLIFGGVAIFIGGLGRVAPAFTGGIVPEGVYAPIFLELVVYPLLLVWDARVRSSRAVA
eukprot:s1_g2456.t1